MAGLKELIREVHRRSLWQVLGIYLVASWVVFEVVQTLTEGLELPAWLPAFALVLLLVGLPIVLATAFVQEGMAPLGSAAESAVEVAPRQQATHHKLFTWRNAIMGGMAAFSLWGVVATGWLLLGPGLSSTAASTTDLRSIAVLPFGNRSAEGEDAAFFAAGMHDDLLTQLSKIEALTVISRTSVMQYEDTRKTIPEIADELGVATVLEGGVQRAGERVRVHVQLIEARTDKHLWAETYDEALTAANVFAIQTDLAKQIAAALEATLAPELEKRLEERPTESLEAYELYTRGRYLYNSSVAHAERELRAVADLFQRAIEADSSYAPAYAALAGVYGYGVIQGYFPYAEAAPQAWAVVEKALELDETLAEAHSQRGLLLMTDQRYDEAERAFRRALELEPGSAVVHRGYSGLLRVLGRHEEAVREGRRAVELDPLSLSGRSILGRALELIGDYSGAIAEYQKTIEMDPTDAGSYVNLGYAYTFTGAHAEAVASLEKALELDLENPYNHTALAWANARAGQRDAALRALQAVPEQGVMLKEYAIVYGELGELDLAFEYLDRAYAEAPHVLPLLESDNSADSLRADPRYAELMSKLEQE